MLDKNNTFHLVFDVLKKKIFSWLLAVFLFTIAYYYGIDKKVILFFAFVLSVFTEIFVGLGLIIAVIPFFGPFLIKIISIPIFWILNALGYIVSAIAIKKGYATELAKSRMITLAMLIGIIIGYITGNIVPL